MSRRARIQLTPDEVRAYVGAQKVASIATIGPNGRPHLIPVWYVPRGDAVATWTYASSQKIANLRRLAEATVLIEDGDSYETLRGVSMECDVHLIEDTAEVAVIGQELLTRYSPAAEEAEGIASLVAAQARKRVGVLCTPTKIVSWDHRKLGGAY